VEGDWKALVIVADGRQPKNKFLHLLPFAFETSLQIRMNNWIYVVLGAIALFSPAISVAQKSNQSQVDMKYTSITPSAIALIKLKSYTQIPFAKKAAALLGEDSLGRDIKQGSPEFFRRLIHFENRYWTIDKLLTKVNPKNILEFSSGYSFRGLDMCLKQNINFIDTDLPAVISDKQKMIKTFMVDSGAIKGHLQLLPLNVLNKDEFMNVISRFPIGPVTLVNEGLLVYFDLEEKRKLCSIIHEVLKTRGGYWITADIYIKTDEPRVESPAMEAFRKEHHLDENRFEDYASAKRFFADCGFEVVYTESLAIEQLSCLQLLSPGKRQAVVEKLQNAPHTRQTWCLAIAKK
jgi:hypothetical protein